MRVLVVEDEVVLAAALRDGLRTEGFEVTVAHDGITGRDLAMTTPFDAVVLDIMLPGRNGYRVCRDLRTAGVNTPILMLTAKDGELDEAEALDTGADDFLSKPFSFVVLLARLRALQRRSMTTAASGQAVAGHTGAPVRCGPLVLEPAQRRGRLGEHELALTAREFDLLAELARSSPNVVSKTGLLERVWGAEFEGDPNVVEVYVGYLRRKIDVPYGRASLVTVRGMGYRLDAEA